MKHNSMYIAGRKALAGVFSVMMSLSCFTLQGGITVEAEDGEAPASGSPAYASEAELDAALAERDATLQEMDHAVAVTGQAVDETGNTIAGYEAFALNEGSLYEQAPQFDGMTLTSVTIDNQEVTAFRTEIEPVTESRSFDVLDNSGSVTSVTRDVVTEKNRWTKIDTAQGTVVLDHNATAVFHYSSTAMMANTMLIAVPTNTDLKNFTNTVSIQGVTPESDGTYSLDKNKPYQFKISFKEKAQQGSDAGKQFNMDQSMTYQLPFKPTEASNGTITFNVQADGVTYPVEVPYECGEDGRVSVNWNSNADNFQKLYDANNAEFEMAFTGSFDGTQKSLDFGNGKTVSIKVNTTEGTVSIQKSGTYHEKDNQIQYTVTVRAVNGYMSNIPVHDIINGTALTLDASSIQINAPQGTTVTQTSATDKSFNYTIDHLDKDQTVAFIYYCNIDMAKITDKGTEQQVGNIVYSDEKNQTENHDGAGQIGHTYMTKAAGDITDIGNDQKSVSWSAVYNKYTGEVAGGRTITDTISDQSKAFMSYPADGSVTVDVFDQNDSLIRTDNIQFGTKNLILSSDKTGWTYTIPSTDTASYYYKFTYVTDVDMSKVQAKTTAVNTIGDGTEGHSATASKEIDNIGVSKEVAGIDKTNKTITWKVTLNVPAAGLKNAVLKDYTPYTWSNGSLIREELTNDNIKSVEGLTENESYIFKQHYDGQDSYVEFTFKHNGKDDGLQATGQRRSIILTYTTPISDQWPSSSSQHYNKAEFVSDELTVSADATATLAETFIQKNGWKNSNVAEDGMPVYEFEVKFGGAKGDVDIADTLDEETAKYLEMYQPNPNADAFKYYYPFAESLQVTGLDQWKNQVSSAIVNNKVTYTMDGDGRTIHFHISGSDLPKDNNGLMYPYYSLKYLLKVKNQDVLNAMNLAAARNGGKLQLGNTAFFDNASDKYDVTTDTNFMNKTHAAPYKADDGHYYADYTLDLNTEGYDLDPDKETITVTDTIGSNMAFVYESIHPDDATVKYDISGNTASFTVPDGKHVTITYKCRLNGDGSNQYSNTLKWGNFSKTDEFWQDVGTNAGGHASDYSLKVFKYRKGDMTQGLAGAEYKLERKNSKGNWETCSSGSPDGYFTTGDSGYFTISKGINNEWSLQPQEQYRLTEVKAPSGYQIDKTQYLFQIGNQSDYSKYIYINGDTLKVADKPSPAEIRISKKVNSSQQADHEKKFTFTITTGDESGNGKLAAGSYDAVIKTEGKSEQKTQRVEFAESADGKHTKSSVNLKDNENIAIAVDSGTIYSVAEKQDNDFSTTSNNDRNITASTDGTATTAEFYNTRKEGCLKITKKVTVEGKTVDQLGESDKTKADGTYYFEIKDSQGNPVGNPVAITVKNGTAEPRVITGLTPGNYTVSELIDSNHPMKAGISLVSPERNNISIAVEDQKTASAEFTNNYHAQPASDTLKATKVIQGRALIDGEFTFKLEQKVDGRWNKVQEMENSTAPSDNIVFDQLTFDHAGTYEYRVSEKTPPADQKDNHITYDSSIYYVTYTIEDNGKGNLIIKNKLIKKNNESISESIEFSNVYTPSHTDDSKVNYKNDKLTLVKKDSTENKILKGAEYGIYRNETCTQDEMVNVLYPGKEGMDTVTTDKELKNFLPQDDGDVHAVTLYVKEIKAPEGYVLDTVAYPIRIVRNTVSEKDAEGKDIPTVSYQINSDSDNIINHVMTVKDTQTSIRISKVDITDQKELTGAHIQIITKDENGNDKVVSEWDSNAETEKNGHEVTGLKTGVTYTLRETVAPEGYNLTADTTFTLDKNGQIDKDKTTTINNEGVLLVEDTRKEEHHDDTPHETTKQVRFRVQKRSRTAPYDPLADTTYGLYRADTKELVEKETSDVDGNMYFTKLEEGVKYYLKEISAPTGHEVDPDPGKPFSVKFVNGIAELLDESGDVQSTAARTEVQQTQTDLASLSAGTGEAKAEGHTDGVTAAVIGKAEEVNSLAVSVTVSAFSDAMQANVSARIGGFRSLVLYHYHTSFMKDAALTGGQLYIQSDGGIALNDFDSSALRLVIMNDDGTVVSPASGTLEIVNGVLKGISLPAGNYSYVGIIQPEDSTRFDGILSADSFSNVTDDVTKLDVVKTNENGQPLAGAVLQIKDLSTGRVMAEWKTDGTVKSYHRWFNENEKIALDVNTKYVLHEVSAPDGYDTAEDIVFSLNQYDSSLVFYEKVNGEWKESRMTAEYKLTMVDQKAGTHTYPHDNNHTKDHPHKPDDETKNHQTDHGTETPHPDKNKEMVTKTSDSQKQPKETQSSTTVNTGVADNSAWLGLFVIAVLGLAAVLLRKKRMN